MSAIPYSISTHLSEKLEWPREFYQTAFEVFTIYSGFEFVFSSDGVPNNSRSRAVEPVTVQAVLKHVVFRTLQFDKVFEFIRSGDMVKGNPSSAIPGIHLSESAIRRVLNGFSPPYSDYLIKLRFMNKGKPIITSLLGLNLPGLLQLALVCWTNALDEERLGKDILEDRPNRKPSNLMLRGRCLLENLVEASEPWKPAFEFLIDHHARVIDVHDLEAFIEKWKRHFPSSKDRKLIAGVWLREMRKDCGKLRELRKVYLQELDK